MRKREREKERKRERKENRAPSSCVTLAHYQFCSICYSFLLQKFSSEQFNFISCIASRSNYAECCTSFAYETKQIPIVFHGFFKTMKHSCNTFSIKTKEVIQTQTYKIVIVFDTVRLFVIERI